jgi:hypothetical protein
MSDDNLPAVTPTGIILVAHEVLTQITQEHMLAALPPEYRGLPREVVYLRAVSAKLSELPGFDWTSARRQQAEEIRSRLQPMIDSHPSWRVQYFGAAPIPLAMDLGYVIGGWAAVDVYQQRHDTNAWGWPRGVLPGKVQFQEIQFPKERIGAEGHVVIRVSVSHRIDPSETAAVIPHSLGEIDIALLSPHEDALESSADLEALKEQFDKAVDWAHAARPNAELHVFAAMTVGAAFRLGMAVNPTIHSPVHTYQYSKVSTLRYEHALVLQRDDQKPKPLSSEQVTEAAGFRSQIGEELDRIRSVATELRERDQADPSQSWLKAALPAASAEFFHGPIRELDKIFDTQLADSSVDLINTAVLDNFSYDAPSRMWQFDDRFLVALATQFADPNDRRQASRLLLLHEGVHLKSHGLTGATAPQVRRFPKILEELDYQADVWAFLHDYAIQLGSKSPSNEETRAFFIRVVTVALDTFWAFDAEGDQQRIEIRRLNRYLIWYWQLLQLEDSSDLPGVLRVLENRPVIEIAGPKVESRGDRVYYSLDPARFNDPELGLLYNKRILRYGHGPGTRVRDVLIGFRERDKQKIRDGLKSVSDQMPRSP